MTSDFLKNFLSLRDKRIQRSIFSRYTVEIRQLVILKRKLDTVLS